MPDPLPQTITYGTVLRIRHVETGALLTSLNRPYVHQGTSHQYMVGGTANRDDSTLWLIKPPDAQKHINLDGHKIPDGGILRLEHKPTRRNLHSHNNPAPMSGPAQYEVTAFYGAAPGDGDVQDDWILSLAKPGEWVYGKPFRLKHSHTGGRALHSHGIADPSRTGGLFEVTAVPRGDANDLFIAEPHEGASPCVELSLPSPRSELNGTTTEPNQKSGVHPVLDYFRKEWGNVNKAPFFFFVCIISGAGTAYWLANSINSGEMREKNATIQRLSLKSESVPVQEQELKVLRSEIAKLRADSAHFISDGGPQSSKDWSPLTDDQISAWVSALKNTGLKTLVVYWGQEVGAKQFYLSLKEVGAKVKFDVRAGSGNASGPEIEIVAVKDEPSATIIKGLLTEMVKGTACPVKFEPLQTGETKPSGEVSIFIGEKP